MRYPSISVLVVDISRSRRRDSELVAYLREKGFQLKAVRDPKRAEETIRKGNVQIVFLLLATRGNPNLSSILRRFTKANSDLPTLVISPKPSLAEATESIRGRAFDYLSSPCCREDLEDSVLNVIGEKGYLQSPEDRLQRTVGERLRKTRVGRDLTLRQLSNRTGLSVSLISQIELARSCASVGTLFKLSRALKVKMNDIFAGF